jgi:hypothetical protein
MAKKYLTPDFDVTVFEIKDVLTSDDMFTDDDTDAGFGGNESFTGDTDEDW